VSDKQNPILHNRFGVSPVFPERNLSRDDAYTYYADDQRENLINFATGALDSLITCHRISEGIDVQSTNNIVLFSAARARLETIQRMGRCLRVDPANPAGLFPKG
jgi:ERCC4-related helicase